MIPKTDNDLGIFVYCTNFAGCGGKIRTNSEDFKVSEILSTNSLSGIRQNEGYAVYKLKKQNIDTLHALKDIFRKYRLRLKSFGLKDASAVTEQYLCAQKKNQSIEKISDDFYTLTRIGFVKKPLSKKDMVGNHFRIKITNPTRDISQFDEYNKILNFYGYQRFGSKRPVTHLIGKAILQKDFEKAVNLLLCFTSKYDSTENSELRKRLSDRAKFSKLLQEIPLHMDLERIVVKEMICHNDANKAIRALPIFIRRLFVQAFQSYIFNQTLSNAFKAGEKLFVAQGGDVCFDKSCILGKFSNLQQQHLAIPLVGYSYYKKTRFDFFISKILKSEEVSPKAFFIKEMQEISNEGGFRRSSIECQNYSVSDNVVEFTLSRGSYATILLREIMKPIVPIIAGF